MSLSHLSSPPGIWTAWTGHGDHIDPATTLAPIMTSSGSPIDVISGHMTPYFVIRNRAHVSHRDGQHHGHVLTT